MVDLCLDWTLDAKQNVFGGWGEPLVLGFSCQGNRGHWKEGKGCVVLQRYGLSF